MKRRWKVASVGTLFLVACPLFSGCDAKESASSGPTAKEAKNSVEAYSRYMDKSRKSEALLNLKKMAVDADAFALTEHVDRDNPMVVEFGVFPNVSSPVCTAMPPKDGKASPEDTDWDAFNGLRFHVSQPHLFQYCYVSSPDRRQFAGWASAPDDSFHLCIRGTMNMDTGTSMITEPAEIPPKECPMWTTE